MATEPLTAYFIVRDRHGRFIEQLEVIIHHPCVECHRNALNFCRDVASVWFPAADYVIDMQTGEIALTRNSTARPT